MAEKKIGDRTYSVGTVLATDAIRLQMRLLKVLGAGIDRLPVILGGVGSNKTDEDKSKSNAAAVAAFTDIFVNGDPDEMTSLIKDIVEIARVKRPSGSYEAVDLDGDFSQNISQLIPVVIFVLKEVFGDFFTEVLGNGLLKPVTKA